MARRIPKAQKFKDWQEGLACLRAGQVPERQAGRRADGSIPVKPAVRSDAPERDVLAACLQWLRSHRLKADRLNNGSFETTSGWHFYGVPGGGDIVGLLPSGRHFEIETKAGRGGALSPAQQKRMRDIRNNNGLYFVVCSVEELQRCFEEQVSDEEMQQVQTGESTEGIFGE